MSIKRIFIAISAIFAASTVFADNSSVTSKKYVDDLMSGYQGKLPGSGANTLMIYDDEDGIGEKAIAATLGNSASAVSVPTVGAVKTGLDGKQDTITGTAGYVMTGTGNAGEVGEKPIYSANTNYSDSLVTAESVNNGVINAVNHSLRRVNANGELDNNGTLWEIADTVVALTFLPAGYTQLEYISMNHNAYIMTDLMVNDFDRVTARVKLYDRDTEELSNTQFPHLFGVSADASSGSVQAKVFRFANGGTDGTMLAGYYNKWSFEWSPSTNGKFVPLNVINDFDIKLAAGEQYIKMNNQVQASNSLSATLVNPYPVPLFGMSYAGNIRYFPHIDCYGVKFYLGDTVVRDFIPASRTENGETVVGMYDKITGRFFTSETSSGFVAGPAVGN